MTGEGGNKKNCFGSARASFSYTVRYRLSGTFYKLLENCIKSILYSLMMQMTMMPNRHLYNIPSSKLPSVDCRASHGPSDSAVSDQKSRLSRGVSQNVYCTGIAMAPDLLQRRIRALRIGLVEAHPWMPIFVKLNDF